MAATVLFVLVLAMFSHALFSGSIMLSKEGTDLTLHFARWRAFGFGELSRGNLPLWNPHLFCGSPYVGGFQSAMFYPPNLLHLILPNVIAINWLIAIHVFLCGLWMYVWACEKGLSWTASLLAGVLFMFCGANFLHIFAGHLSIIYSAPWIPLLFWSLDRFVKQRSLGSGLVCTLSVTLEILAGHPQTVFYTAIAAVLYASFHLFKAQQRGWLLAGWAAMSLGVIGLTAVQVLPGLDATSENVRSQDSFAYAAKFSFPPENLLTLLVPGILGDNVHSPYWGRCHFWEMCLFFGITGFVLSIYATICGPKEQRRFLAPLAVLMLLLALGCYTPLFKVLYNYAPGFNKFRGNSKFGLQASLFLTMLAGIGTDLFLIRPKRITQKQSLIAPLILGSVALVFAIAGIVAYGATVDGTADWWKNLILAVLKSGESYLPERYYKAAEFYRDTGRYAATSLFISAGTLALLAGLIFAIRYSSRAVHIMLALAVLEIFIFARTTQASQDTSARSIKLVNLEKYIIENPDDYRMLNMIDKNGAMLTNAQDIWGYDPSVSLRYSQFMTHTQHGRMDTVSQYVEFTQPDPLFRMLRLRHVFYLKADGVQHEEMPDPLPHVTLITDFTVETDRDKIFAIMDNESFDPAKRVVLERQPNPMPIASKSPGSAKIIDRSTDHLTIEADVATPAILLVTDGYSKHWRIDPLPGSSQQQYELMPANYVLRAVPLAAGHHKLRMEYAPNGFRIGKRISLVSLAGYLALAAWWGCQILMARRLSNPVPVPT